MAAAEHRSTGLKVVTEQREGEMSQKLNITRRDFLSGFALGVAVASGLEVSSRGLWKAKRQEVVEYVGIR